MIAGLFDWKPMSTRPLGRHILIRYGRKVEALKPFQKYRGKPDGWCDCDLDAYRRN